MSKFTSSSGRKSRDNQEDAKQQKKAATGDYTANGNESKKFRSSGASNDQASSSLAALPEPGARELELEEKVASLTEALNSANLRAQNAESLAQDAESRAQNAEERAQTLRTQLTSANRSRSATGTALTSTFHGSFEDKSDRRQQELVKEANDKLANSNFVVVKRSEIPEVDVEKSASFFYLQGMTVSSYKAASLFPRLAPYSQIEKWTDELFEQIGGFEMRKADYIKKNKPCSLDIYTARDMKKLVTYYVQHLYNNEWRQIFPETAVQIVFCGDKGGTSTKLGFYIPTNVQNPLSPKRFVVLAAWEGSEDYEALEAAAEDVFRLIADLEVHGLKIKTHLDTELTLFLTPVFNGDFKFLSTVLGHQGGSSKFFCIKCDVSKDNHNARKTKGTTRDFNAMYKEGRAVKNINRKPLLIGLTANSIGSPALHILTGLTTKLLECASDKDSNRVNEILREAKVSTKYGGKAVNGNNMDRLLNYLSEDLPSLRDFPYLDAFRCLNEVKKLSVARILSPVEIAELEKAIDKFSRTYRAHSELNRINKLHELETHTMDFVKEHGSWGLYSEQSLESIHKFSNKADRQAFGINQEKNVTLFVKRQLGCCFSVEY